MLEQSEMVLRLKSSENERLREKYAFDTVHILDGWTFQIQQMNKWTKLILFYL
jgi:hypothetical protein